MKAQELRDRLAPVRNFTVKVNGKDITHQQVIINIAEELVLIITDQASEEKKVEVKK